MALQSQDLVMVGLGVLGDTPPNSEQLPLVDGVHLRWAFQRDLGFPWHGFYLFRRLHIPGIPVCPLENTRSWHIVSRTRIDTQYGIFESDTELLPGFSPGFKVEFDLSKRQRLRFSFPEEQPARRVEALIGFHTDPSLPPPQRHCVTFRGRPLSFGSNPRIEQGVRFDVKDDRGRLVEFTKTLTWETDPDLISPDQMGLRFGNVLEITLPARASAVELVIKQIYPPVIVEAFNDDATSAGAVGVDNPEQVPETLRLTGPAITRIVINAPGETSFTGENTYLLDFCYEVMARPPSEIEVTGFSRQVPFAVRKARGFGGQNTSIILEYDMITAVEFSSGPAGLVDLCFVPVDQEATKGWEKIVEATRGGETIKGFTYPMCLPVAHEDYPCEKKPGDDVEARDLALSRIVYGAPDQGAKDTFGELHEEMQAMVTGGPSAGSMANRFRLRIGGVSDPPESFDRLPEMPVQYPLDMILLGALHPAFAQMVGLYWADQTANDNVPYDYLLLGDYHGTFEPRFKGATAGDAHLQPDTLGAFNDVEGYIVFNLKKAPASPLPAPVDVRAYSLPGAGIPSGRSGLADATNNAGLTWDLPLTRDIEVLPAAPFIYHVWRASLGNGDSPNSLALYQLITKDEPVAVTSLTQSLVITSVGKMVLPSPMPQRSSEWPPFRLNFIDNGLDEGWYGYQVSGIDIFGRHSHNSDAAKWFQWVPPPEPLPWYYRQPAGEAVVHPSAVRLLDKTPPPPPTAIEAFALDAADPWLVKDDAYLNWQRALNAAPWYQALTPAQKAGLIGLRVRWQWTEAHAHQAADTREFRIYFHSDPMNAILGRTSAVSSGPFESVVHTDIASTKPADAFAGATLQTSVGGFSILAGVAAATPGLRVKNIGPLHSVGKIKVTRSAQIVEGANTSWHDGLEGMVLQVENESIAYRILRVDSPSHLTLERNYQGASTSGNAYQIYKTPVGNEDCTVVIPDLAASGRVSVAKGSNIVTGAGTDWSETLIGTRIRVEGHPAVYSIRAVNLPSLANLSTELVLDRNYEGETGREKNYTLTHPLFVDYTLSKNWQQRQFVAGFDDHLKFGATPFRDPLGNELSGKLASVVLVIVFPGGGIGPLPAKPPKGPGKTVVSLGADPKIPGSPHLSGIKKKVDEHLEPVYLFLENDANSSSRAYAIVEVDDLAKKVTVEGAPEIGVGPSPWIIGVPVRKYELFLPEPAGPATDALPLITSSASPIAYASIGVSSADGRTHTLDSPKWASSRWGNRLGNEGPVGAPAKVYRVHREQPQPPSLPSPLDEKVFATRADYHGRSFYTFRWLSTAGLKTQIYRALDDSVFKTDWLIRTTRSALTPELPRHDAIFPRKNPDGSSWDPNGTRAAAVARLLNAISSLAGYDALSVDARTVLARLPGNQGFEWRDGPADPTSGMSLQERDWLIRSSRVALAASDTQFFPADWTNPARRDAAAIQIRNMISMLHGTAASLADIANQNVTLDGTSDLSSVVAHRDTLWLKGNTTERTMRRYGITNVEVATRTLTLDEVPDVTGATSEWAIFFDEYRDLTDDALRVLPGLPGNESAFSQVTTTPLDANEPDPENPSLYRWRNRRCPDDADSFAIDDPAKPLTNHALLAYTDELDGKSDNRYFYRAAFVDGAHNQSALGLAGPPVYLPDLTPPSKPRILKVVAGDRRITLQWRANRELGIHRYLIYRSEEKEKSRDIRSMGEAVANLPAKPLISATQEVDLGAGTDIILAERIYDAAGFDPSADLLEGQSANQYLFRPVEATGTRIINRLIPDATNVVVVYRDSHRGLQCTAWKDAPRIWTDEGQASAREYYYRLVASRERETATGTVLLHSEPSDVALGRTVELTPTEPPTWSQTVWVLLRDSDGGEEPWPADGVIAAGKRPALKLVWTTDAVGASFVVSRKARDENVWRPVAVESGYRQIVPTDYLLYDDDVSADRNYNYRIRAITRGGVTSLTLREIAIPRP